MTSHIQPLDVGILWCFKAHYCHQLCTQAIKLNEAGTEDIYKIDILEAMHMANKAWEVVSELTIKHCWDHTKILLYALLSWPGTLNVNLRCLPWLTLVQSKRAEGRCRYRSRDSLKRRG